MNNLKIYCLCIHDELLEKVKKLNYIPVALGENDYQKGWLRDNIGLVSGTHENWETSKLKINSLKELKEKSGIQTSFF